MISAKLDTRMFPSMQLATSRSGYTRLTDPQFTRLGRQRVLRSVGQKAHNGNSGLDLDGRAIRGNGHRCRTLPGRLAQRAEEDGCMAALIYLTSVLWRLRMRRKGFLESLGPSVSKEPSMKRLNLISMALISAFCVTFAAPALAQHEHPAGGVGKLGKVNFPISCDPSVQPQFNAAVAMLHSFWYEKASDTFAAVAQNDPHCGMAYWGIAMTHYHPIWEAPGPADLKAGVSAVEQANAAGAKTQREQDYIAAIGTFYKDND